MSSRLRNAPLLVAAGLLVFPGAGDATDRPVLPAGECGTQLTGRDVGRSLEAARRGVHRLPPERRGGPWEVRTALHIVRTDAGLGGMSEGQLTSALDKLNADFAPAGIQFTVVDPIDYIDSDAFYYDVDTVAEINLLRTTNPVDHALNLYFTGNMPYCGLSSFSWQAVQGIVLVNACVVTPWNPSTFTHEVGHYFDLLHTHETAYGAECVDGSNCATAGDLICDTPADPRLDRCGPGGNEYCVDPACAYTGGFVDACAGDPYGPSTENLMSYSRPLCRDVFTPEQRIRAAATLLNVRSDHVLDAVAVGAPGDAPGPRSMLAGPFPNPTTGRVALVIRVRDAGLVRVGLFDPVGRWVAGLLDRDLPPGTHRFDWEPPVALSSGVYYLVLTHGPSRETRRLVWLSGLRP